MRAGRCTISGQEKEKARVDWCRCGPWPVQLRFATNLTSTEYVSQQAWRRASLERCPLHPEGGCGFKRNGTYERQEPPDARVPRWYCPTGHRTFSLLADCLAARLPGSLSEVEQVVSAAEQASSLEAAADKLRPDILLPGGLRWVRRRTRLVHAALAAMIALCPARFGNCEPTLGSVRARLGSEPVLPALRRLAEAQLPTLSPPLGFGSRERTSCPQQHDSGPRGPPAPW